MLFISACGGPIVTTSNNERIDQALRKQVLKEIALLQEKKIAAIKVKNNTSYPISKAYFSVIITSPGRSIPWIKEDFSHSIPGGIEPGEKATWGIYKDKFGPWGQADVPIGATQTVECIRVDGLDGKPLTTTVFTKEDEARLIELQTKYGMEEKQQ